MIDLKKLSYYFFVILVFAFFNLLKSKEHRKKALTFINFCFIVLLFYYRKKHLIILFTFLGANFFAIKYLFRNKENKWWGAALIFEVLFALCFYKYSLFQNMVLGVIPIASYLLKPLVFIGISFFTFKMISLVVDIQQGKVKEEPDFFHYFNYLLFFPCYLSGPLDRYNRFVEDFDSSTSLNAEETYRAVFRIIWGLFKKVVIADSLFGLSVFKLNTLDIPGIPLSSLFVGMYLYTLVLYIDFSGYSDIAIGISNLFGVKTPENFNYPLTARNIQEFWNRWHITFIHWLRDYIYFPLQMFLIRMGIKNYVAVAAFSYIVTFTLAGIWHGDKSEYAWYGFCHGMALAIFHVYDRYILNFLSEENRKKYNESKTIRVLANVVTYHYFMFSLMIFLGHFGIFKKIWESL